MKAPNPKELPGGGSDMFCRILLCTFGAFFIGYGTYDYLEHGHYLGPLVFDLSVGLILTALGIFASGKLCQRIIDSL